MDLLPLRFTKMSGAGNTFLVISPELEQWQSILRQTQHSASEWAQIVCDPVLGVRADGFLILSKATAAGADYAWEFYNSDGSTAEMCGNAARCAARYCYEILEKKQKAHFIFQTGAGLVETFILGNGLVRVSMPETLWVKKEINVKTDKNTETFAWVNSGVPHLVQKIHAFKDAVDLKEMAREVRRHPSLGSAGANVTFYSVESAGHIHAVTFERGVEDYTLACGTGAVAAAFVHHDERQSVNVEVTMPGGNMRVYFAENQKRPLMEGEAVFIGDFYYSLEVFL